MRRNRNRRSPPQPTLKITPGVTPQMVTRTAPVRPRVSVIPNPTPAEALSFIDPRAAERRAWLEKTRRELLTRPADEIVARRRRATSARTPFRRLYDATVLLQSIEERARARAASHPSTPPKLQQRILRALRAPARTLGRLNRRAYECLRRHTRRAVLFAKRLSGRHGGGRSYRRTPASAWSC